MNDNEKTVMVVIICLIIYLFWRLVNNNTTEGFKSKESFHEIVNIHSDLENYDKLNKLCEAVELQDKISQEKIKLEKTKQYYLKSEQQQAEIKKLKEQIAQLKERRNKRTKSNDILKLAKYEKQSAVEAKLKEDMLNRIKKQKTLDIDLQLKPFKAEEHVFDRINPNV